MLQKTVVTAFLAGLAACDAPPDNVIQADNVDIRCPTSAGAFNAANQPLLGRIAITDQPAAPASETFECSCADRTITYDTNPIELRANYQRCNTLDDA